MAQDDYYYEIQLSNKQLVFYFLAGATALILSFLAGIWVGRGVDARATETRVAREEPVVPVSEDALARRSPAPAEGYSYPQRLEAERPVDTLETPETSAARAATKPAPTTGAPAASSTPLRVPPAPERAPLVKPTPAASASGAAKVPAAPSAPPSSAAKATPSPRATKPPTPAPTRTADASSKPGTAAKKATPGAENPQAPGGTLMIQVGAFRERERADGVVAQLRKKGYPAHVAAPAGEKGGLFNVTVGPYKSRVEADRVMSRLTQQERFKPFVVHQ